MKYDRDFNIYQKPDHVFGLAIKGNATALDQLFSSCMPQLQRTAARLLGNSEDSEDALQDGLLSAFRHLDQFQGRAQFTTWMHAIVVNAAKSKLRKQSSQPLISSLEEPLHGHDDLRLADMLADTGPDLDEQYVWIERSRVLAGILQNLTPALRDVIFLCDIEGLQIKEAAERLDVSVSAMKARHHRAFRLVLKFAQEASTRSDSNLEGHDDKPAPKNSTASSNSAVSTNRYRGRTSSRDKYRDHSSLKDSERSRTHLRTETRKMVGLARFGQR